MNKYYGAQAKVEYLDETEREKYRVQPGGTLSQDGQPFTTAKMFSKEAGAGSGIFVMSPDGAFYSNSHKVGLFHHSSFLAGLPTAGAGEWQVDGGALKVVTHKSGHYRPDATSVLQTLQGL